MRQTSIRPVPPVYDPARIAQAVVRLAVQPKSETMISSLSYFLRTFYAPFPRLTSSLAGVVINGYLKQAESIEKTDGNVFETVPFGNAVYGGWGSLARPSTPKIPRFRDG